MADLNEAVDVIRQGGVIAYPTEYCFGLGCDPFNVQAIQRILDIKRRQSQQGLILIGSQTSHLEPFVNLAQAPFNQQILDSWPGPHTWLINAKQEVSQWVRGKHSTVAVRLTNHHESSQLCSLYGGAIISTSANRHGEPELMTAQQIRETLVDEVDYVVDALVGGAANASQIRDGNTGKRLR